MKLASHARRCGASNRALVDGYRIRDFPTSKGLHMSAPASPVSGSIGCTSPPKARSAVSFKPLRGNAVFGRAQIAWVLALLLVVPLADTCPGSVETAYEHARQLFLHGDLIRSQQEAERGYRRFRDSNAAWAAK